MAKATKTGLHLNSAKKPFNFINDNDLFAVFAVSRNPLHGTATLCAVSKISPALGWNELPTALLDLSKMCSRETFSAQLSVEDHRTM